MARCRDEIWKDTIPQDGGTPAKEYPVLKKQEK